MLARPDTFVFDFDGTLADSMRHVVELYNSITERFGVPTVTAEDVMRLRRLGPREAMAAFGIPLWKVPGIVSSVRTRMRERVDRLEPFEGMREALAALRQGGSRCLVVTSNSRENVEAFLSRHRLDSFERLVCGSSLFGKATRLRRVLSLGSLDPSKVAYVGDEVRDIEAARTAGVQSIAVSWGYADRDVLLAANPDYLIDSPGELLALGVKSDRS